MRAILPMAVWLTLFLAGAWARADGDNQSVPPTNTFAAPATAIGIRALGQYQARAVQRALAERGLELDPHPEGKRVGRIIVKNFDVFDDDDGVVLAWTNLFHMTTRENIIAREVLLLPQDAWDWVVAEETRRRLANSLFTSFVAVVPVRAKAAHEVDVLVVTRDIFSLRLNTEFEYQGDVWSWLHIEPAENNFLGRRKRLSAVFDMNQGRYSVGPHYFDSNIAGTRWQLSSYARALIGRDSDQLEGKEGELTVSHPLWAYSRHWGGSFSVSHFEGTLRRFLGSSIRPYDDPATTQVEQVPWRYRYRSASGSGSITHQRGQNVIQRFSTGYSFNLRRPSVFEDDFVGQPELQLAFERDVLPRSERVSAPFVSYNVFTPRFVTFHDVSTFDLPEDVALGPDLTLAASWAAAALGTEMPFVSLSGSVGFAEEVGRRGLVSVSAGAASRMMSNELVDQRYWGSGFFATPKLWSVARVVMRLGVDSLFKHRGIRNLELGGDSGLRGYPIGAFQGQALARGNVELRSAGLKVAFTRLGVAGFWDFGHAAARFSDLAVHHNFGMGFRLLIPQLQPTVIRFDWAFATQGPTAGFPGRFSAGFSQAF